MGKWLDMHIPKSECFCCGLFMRWYFDTCISWLTTISVCTHITTDVSLKTCQTYWKLKKPFARISVRKQIQCEACANETMTRMLFFSQEIASISTVIKRYFLRSLHLFSIFKTSLLDNLGHKISLIIVKAYSSLKST